MRVPATTSEKPKTHLPSASAEAAQGRNTTSDRTIDVLLLFDERRPVLSAAEVSRSLAMPRSTTYRYLQTLRSSGLIEEDPVHGGFRLGPRVFHLARVARQGLGLSEVALPFMHTLSEQTGEVVLLTRRSGNQVVCVERVESSFPIRLSYERGHLLPLHAGASAKVLLAFSEASEIDEVIASLQDLPRFTERTVLDPSTMRAQLTEIRERGVAITDGEVDQGVRGVAAPILGADGRIVAGVSVAGPSFRLDASRLPETAAAVKEAAARVSARLREING